MTHYFARSAGALVLAASLLIGDNSVFSALYSVEDLGVLTDLSARNDSKPNAISSNGKVAAVNVTNGAYRAFLYSGVWTNLGTLDGTNSFGFGINDSGLGVGLSLTSDGSTRAFLWTPGGTDGIADNPQMKDLETFAGGTNSEADSINNAGQIAGYAQTSLHDHAFLYGGGTMTDVGDLLPPNLPNSYGLGINDMDHIVGEAYDEFFTSPHAFFYDGNTPIDIGNLGGPSASALAINHGDHIAGYSAGIDLYIHAFHYFGGTMHDLGTLGGHYSYAIGINNSNVIVGGSYVDVADSIYHAFVSDGNTMLDLNSQLDASGAGWVLAEARAVNDSGQIAGVGQFGGDKHAFLLNPYPVIKSVKVSGVDVVVGFTTINTVPYTIVGSEALISGSWSNLMTGVVGNGSIVTVTNTGAAGRPQRFYRASFSLP